MTITPSAKHLLAKTIRGLREHLTDALAGATEAAYRCLESLTPNVITDVWHSSRSRDWKCVR